MVKPVYDISPPDLNAIDWQHCRLAMEMNDQYFLYTVISSGTMVVALKYYAFAVNTGYPLRDQLYEIVKSDEVLHRNMNDVIIIYNLPENALIPEEFFSQEVSHELMDFLHGDLRKGTLLSEKLEQEKTYNVIRVPSEIHEFFQTGFPAARFWHYFSIWSACTPAGARSIDGVSVIFYPHNLLVSVYSGGKQQLLQSMQYQTPEDVAYHLLNIFHQFGFSQEDTPLEIGGLVDMDSAVYEELLKYFQVIEKISYPPNLQLPPAFESLPEHFFSPLLKLAVCVS